MKILMVNKFFYLKGGAERVFFQEREFLLKKGIKVIDFSMSHPQNFASPYSSYFVSFVDYYTNNLKEKLKYGLKFIYSFEAKKKITSLIKKEKPNIAHLHNFYHQLTPAILHPLKKENIKIIYTVHDGKLICPSYAMLDKNKNICVECQGRYFYKPLIKNCYGSRIHEVLLMVEAYCHKWLRSYEKIDLFLVPSRFYVELISMRVPKEKIRILRNGVELKEYIPTYEDKGYVLYFGRLSKEKGIEILLKAHQDIAKEIPLKIVGTGLIEDELKAKYPRVEFLGYRTGKELKSIISRASFVVMPSECYENCSMAVLEAMALGKPIIASRIGGLPEQVEDGRTGLLFEMGNVEELKEKMLYLWKNKDLRIEMGKEARKKAEREFSLERHCEKLLQIYKKLLQSN
ncbi:MAG: glycosyltransferase family 1 protein [Thermodesulfobacteriota bacterium]|nr:MAG: glycosyltransferase family 1 protein [Thermodesulfobacteriota bacterium]